MSPRPGRHGPGGVAAAGAWRDAVRRAAWVHRSALVAIATLSLPVIFLLLFFVLPLLDGIGTSIDFPNFNLAGYRRIFTVPVYTAVFLRTLQLSCIVTVLSLVLGFVVASFVAGLSPRNRAMVLGLILLPFLISVLARNYVWMLLLQETGLINRTLLALGIVDAPLRLIYNQAGVVIAMCNMLLPYSIFPILSALLAIPADLTLASKSLGGHDITTFLRVTLPLTVRGVAAGGLLTFIVSLGFYITPAMLGGNREIMMAGLIAYNVREVLNWSLAFSLSTTLLCTTVVLYFVYRTLLPSAVTLRAT